MDKIIELYIQKDSIDPRYQDRSELLKLEKNPKLIASNGVVYIYSLVNQTVNYPNRPGKTLYIGEAYRNGGLTGARFRHISSDTLEANDSNSNWTLTTYYENGLALKLVIYTVRLADERFVFESLLIKKHMVKYGCQPIAQGSSGATNTPKKLMKAIQDASLVKDIEL